MKATPALTLVPATGTHPSVDTHVSTDPDAYAVARLVAALEDAWNAIRTRHPEIPRVAVILGSGTGVKHPKHGHFAPLRWQHTTTGQEYSEVLVAGEGLKRDTADVFATLLHEATHALAHARGTKETSRQGRWHNKKFAALATELGLTPEADDAVGYHTTIPAFTTERYAAPITALGEAITLFRHPEPTKPAKKRDNSNNPIPLECTCPRKIKVALSVAEAGVIRCEACGDAFVADGDPQPPRPTPPEAAEDDMHTLDPTGEHHNGMPTYPYHYAPQGLATIRQLRAQGLRPGGQDIAAQILWRKGKRVAYLYRIDAAKPKRQASPAQLAALAKANIARRTCSTCTKVKDYTIPTRYGECLDCVGDQS